MTQQSASYKLYAPKKVSENQHNFLTEQFKTKLTSQDSATSKDKVQEKLGEPHPFDYTVIEGVMKKFGLVSAIIDKISDYTIGPELCIESDDEKISDILEKWMKDTSFRMFLRPWFKEGLGKGSSYLEIAGLADFEEDDMVKTVNSNTMFIKRDEFGEIETYNQFLGNTKNIGLVSDDEVIELDKEEIIQLDINKIGSGAYGMGIVFSALGVINDFLNAQKSMHKIMSRKANSQIHVKLGNAEKEDYPEQGDIDAFGSKLQFMNECTEWVTGPNVEMSILDFGKVGDKFVDVLNNDYKLFSFSFQVPEVILGAGNVAEGLAKVQMDGFERNIKSYQEQLAFIIKTKVFDKVLLNAGIINPDYKIVWGQQNEEDRLKEIDTLQKLLSLMNISPGMRKEIEKKLALAMEIDFEEVEKENKKEQRKEKQDGEVNFQRQLQLKGDQPSPQTPQEKMESKINELLVSGKAPQEIEMEVLKEFKKVRPVEVTKLIKDILRGEND